MNALRSIEKGYYNNPLSLDIEYTNNNEKKIFFGANKELISIYKPDYIIDPNLQDYTNCKNLYSIPIECFIGIRTSFHDKIFKIAIIYKIWKEGVILYSIIKEAERISENIMILE
jgi:hypothetical protein